MPPMHAGPTRARRHRVQLLCLLALGLVILLLAYCEIWHRRAPVAFDLKPYAGAGLPTDLRFAAVIDQAAYDFFRDALSRPYRRIVLASPGGDPEIGEAIGALIRDQSTLPVIVQDGTICGSSCVAILAALPADRRHIDPDGYLFFHASSRARWHDNHCFCKWLDLNFRTMEIGAPLEDPAERQVMGKWAGQLSPALRRFLAQCPAKPLDTLTGLALSSRQIAAIENGPAPDCRAIAEQTSDWLVAKLHARLVDRP
jgi:hypothetical protein